MDGNINNRMKTLASLIIPGNLLLAKLLEELQPFSCQWTFQVIGHYGPCLRLPAQHPAIGDLVIWVEDDEITAEIGRIWHAHFNCPDYLFENSVEEQARAIAQNAADYVLEVLLDLKLYEIKWQGNQLASVSSIPFQDGFSPQKVRIAGICRERYRWSGPCE
jgi:hypothetical protein